MLESGMKTTLVNIINHITSQVLVPSNVEILYHVPHVTFALGSEAKADATMHGRMLDAFSHKLGSPKKMRCHLEHHVNSGRSNDKWQRNLQSSFIGLPFSGKGVTHLDGADVQVVPTQDRLA